MRCRTPTSSRSSWSRRSPAPAPGNLTAVGDDAQSIYRFRGAHYDNILKFPDRNPGARALPPGDELPVDPRDRRVHQRVDRAERHPDSPRPSPPPGRGGPRPLVVATADAYEEADLICQQVLDWREQGIGLSRMAVLYRNHHDSILLQGELAQRGIPYTVRSGLRFFEQAHIKDVLAYLRVHANPKDEPAWAPAAAAPAGDRPGEVGGDPGAAARSDDPLAALETAETMKLVPAKSKGRVRRLRRRPPLDPQGRARVEPLGGHPRRAQGRLSGDRQGASTSTPTSGSPTSSSSPSWPRGTTAWTSSSPTCSWPATSTAWTRSARTARTTARSLVLSTIHQAKGLEWSRVIVPRLVEHGFPGDRALAEPGGEDEERRVFYVAVTRAMDELWLTYPLMVTRPGQGSILTTPEPLHHRGRRRPLRAGRRRERQRPRLDRGPAGLMPPLPTVGRASPPSRARAVVLPRGSPAPSSPRAGLMTIFSRLRSRESKAPRGAAGSADPSSSAVFGSTRPMTTSTAPRASR